MKRTAIVSREYKVMLRAATFAGDEPALLESASAFWNDFSASIEGEAIDTSGALRSVAKRRHIQFFDTPASDLTDAGYIFRVRGDLKGGRPEVTLKFRHEDRYFSESRRIATSMEDPEVKFEEDIKAPFVSLYSYSASAAIRKRETPSDLDALGRMFPSLSRRLDDADGTRQLSAIGGFTARELVITGSTLQIGRKPKIEAECALIVWYDDANVGDTQAVEFSYRYGNQKGQYAGGPARRAFAVFKALQSLNAWIDPHPRTKTRFVLDKQK